MEYRTILADPPWPYRSSGPVGRGNIENRHTSVDVRQHYSVMTLGDIKGIAGRQRRVFPLLSRCGNIRLRLSVLNP